MLNISVMFLLPKVCVFLSPASDFKCFWVYLSIFLGVWFLKLIQDLPLYAFKDSKVYVTPWSANISLTAHCGWIFSIEGNLSLNLGLDKHRQTTLLVKIIVSIETYLVSYIGELYVRNYSLWSTTLEKKVISHSNIKRLQAGSILWGIWKHTKVGNKGEFSFIILLQLPSPIESKCSQICYLCINQP